MTENDFLSVIGESFKRFLVSGSRSNEKLRVLHGKISKHLIDLLGPKNYIVKSLDIDDGKEGTIQGRYMNKKVDIVVLRRKDQKAVAGIGVKFVMQNYSQNSVNYFENMLGETANIRSNNIPYFQIFVIPDTIPYYKSSGHFSKWEEFSQHNSDKYKILSDDNIANFLHTPTKTLLYVVKLPEVNIDLSTKDDYISYYRGLPDLQIQKSDRPYGPFGNNVIHNDYVVYMEKISHHIQSI